MAAAAVLQASEHLDNTTTIAVVDAAARWLTTIDWFFNGGDFDGKPVLPTLYEYLEQVSASVAEAERKLCET